MKGLRALFDISSFFLVMIINLLLIALLCYYFKKKFENLERAQMEQAKILYGLIENGQQQENMHTNPVVEQDAMELEQLLVNPSLTPVNHNTKSIQLHPPAIDSSSDEESDYSDEDESDSEENTPELNINAITSDTIELTLSELPHTELKVDGLTLLKSEDIVPDSMMHDSIVPDSMMEESNTKKIDLTPESASLQKLTVKQLNELVKEKGLKSAKNMKKNDIIDLIQKSE